MILTALGAQANTKIISTRTVDLPVDVSTSKVRYTNKGYGEIYMVKILVPELAEETVMNHRNEGEGAPCLATTEIQTVAELIGNNPGVDTVPFVIELVKSTYLRQDGTCSVSLTENISTTVRGHKFVHVRSSALPDRVGEDCQ